MEYPLLSIFALLNLAVVATHAASPPEFYWKSVLPTTPMPKAITDILHLDLVEDKSTNVGVGKGSINVHAGKESGTNVNVGGKDGGVPVSASPNQFRYNYGATETELHDALNDGKGNVNVHAGKGRKGSGTNVNVGGKGSVNVHAGKGSGSGTNVNVGGKGGGVPMSASPNQFRYKYVATETELHDDLNMAVFFLEKDLHPGTKLNFHFTRSSNAATFLPREVADSIPFSSNKVDDILNKFSFKPESKEAGIVKITINECEEKGIRGEEKYCATSLESMVDFSTSKLGKNVEAVSTEVVDNETKLQKYTMTQGVKKLPGDKVVVCHKQNYPYAVFYCHKTETARAYFVPLEGVNGIRVKAIAVCHTDTSEWNPKHLAFQVLKIKPGNIPVCHFLPEDHVVWVPK
ncbi:BURP domain protein RD22-like [Gastrolobium bilobum]|uniref:BURP domain protein RD22-like n=1 Tax=Gastrolobium bilobum TaxID=150636 RepID=UPI002AB00C62|nr:BURP domain protein RD22-like [Gastrolobium bilobum]